MKTCNKCGSLIENNTSFCGKCGTSVTSDSSSNLTEEKIPLPNNKKSNASLCQKNANNKSIKKNLSSIPMSDKRKIVLISLSIILLVIILICLLFRNPIRGKIYMLKGDKAYLESEKISYYCKAATFSSNDVIVPKISNVLKDMDITNAIEILDSYKNILSQKHYNMIMCNIYEYNAFRHYESNNYNTVIDILKNAETYGYNITSFLHYDEVINKIEKEEIALKQKQEENQNEHEQDRSTEYNSFIYDDYAKREIYNRVMTTEAYIIPNSDTTYLTKSDLKGLSKEVLALSRNEIWARYGYIFKEEPFKSYFANKAWYYPNPLIDGSLEQLTPLERYNVTLIKSIEDSF